MDKNKSIDGLAPRRTSKATSHSVAKKPAPRKTTTKPTTKPTAKKPTAHTATAKHPAVKSAPKAVKSTSKTKPTPAVKPAAPAKTATTSIPAEPTLKTPSEINENFLNPTHVFDFDENSGELKASTAPITTNSISEKPMKKSKKPVSKKRKIITSIILVIVLLLIGGVTWLVVWGNDIIAKITGGQGNVFDLITFVEPTYEPLKTDENGRTNILAFGTSGYNMEGDEGDGTHDGAQLTDSIMVISLDQETGDIAMLSLPRDLKASPTCTATGKINEVYWCNGGKGDATTEEESAAAQALMDEVGDILGINFQYFAHLNWGSLVDIVDTLGGITVTLDEDINDAWWTGAVYEAGTPYTLNGEEALGLSRARHGTAGGDFSRGASQQKILIGIKDKIFEKQLSLTDIVSLASTLGDNLRTNLNVEELKSFAHLASEFDFDSMRQISLIEPERLMTTGTINGISYVLPSGGAGYYAAIQDYVSRMLSSDPRVYEDASILVLNGTDTAGLAATEQTSLEEAGYTNITADNAPEGEYTDEYTLYTLTDTAPGTKKMLEDKYNFTALTTEDLPAGIPTNYDFVIIIGKASESQ